MSSNAQLFKNGYSKDKDVWITRPGIELGDCSITPEEALSDDDHFTTGSGVSCNKLTLHATPSLFYADSSIFSDFVIVPKKIHGNAAIRSMHSMECAANVTKKLIQAGRIKYFMLRMVT